MVRYFFCLEKEGEIVADPEGTELADINVARREAFMAARDMLIRILKTEQAVPLDDNVHVIDKDGKKLYVVTLREALGLPPKQT